MSHRCSHSAGPALKSLLGLCVKEEGCWVLYPPQQRIELVFEAGFAQMLSSHPCCLSHTTFLCFPCPQAVLNSWPHSWTGGRSPWACSWPCPAPRHGHSEQDQGEFCREPCAESSGMSCKGLRAVRSFSTHGICSWFVEHRDKLWKLCSPTKTSCAVSPHLADALTACSCCSISPHQLVPPLVTCPCSFKHPRMFLQLWAEGLLPCLGLCVCFTGHHIHNSKQIP